MAEAVIELDGPAALALIKLAVAEKGEEYTYSTNRGCDYYRDGAPSCIVGHALAYLGVPVEALRRLDEADYEYEDEDGYETTPGSTDIDTLADVGALEALSGVRIDTDAQRVFSVAQKNQDQGVPWGGAYLAAEETLLG